jgi:GNAT superfamily N-acetyltransferase
MAWMTMGSERFTIRPASPDEIDEAVDIDDDACTLFDTVGFQDDLGPQHPFKQAERARWLHAAREGSAFFAISRAGSAVGLLVLTFVDGQRYVEQLSVRRAVMRQGIGRHLLRYAIEWAAGEPLWLTTYAQVPWNQEFYEGADFRVIPESQCPAGIVAILDDQRRWLPAPEKRVAMRRSSSADA